MTRQGWAERKVQAALYTPHKTKLALIQTVSKLLKAEHRRAVRVVERKIANLEVIKSRSFCNAEIAEAYASITVLRDILAALQKGRT